MKGKVGVIAGATSGIGEVAARELAGMGAQIVLVARDVSRGEDVLAQLRGINPGVEHSAHTTWRTSC
jgi:short-subunit dehydrogenase